MAENIIATRVAGGPESIRSSRQFELVKLTGAAVAAATGSITFDSNPADGDTITVNGVVYTFLDTPVAGTDIQIGATAADTATNLQTVLDASADPLITVATYTVNGTVVSIVHDTPGAGGNAFTLATDSAAITLSGATLSGGVTATAADDTSNAYPSGIQNPSFCVGAATVSVSGNLVTFKTKVALAGDSQYVKLYSQ